MSLSQRESSCIIIEASIQATDALFVNAEHSTFTAETFLHGDMQSAIHMMRQDDRSVSPVYISD